MKKITKKSLTFILVVLLTFNTAYFQGVFAEEPPIGLLSEMYEMHFDLADVSIGDFAVDDIGDISLDEVIGIETDLRRVRETPMEGDSGISIEVPPRLAHEDYMNNSSFSFESAFDIQPMSQAPFISDIRMFHNGVHTNSIPNGASVTVEVRIHSRTVAVNTRVYVGTAANPRAHFVGPMTFTAGQTSRTTSAFTITTPPNYTRIFVTASNSFGDDEWEIPITIGGTGTDPQPQLFGLSMARNGIQTGTINSGDSVTLTATACTNTQWVDFWVGTASNEKAHYVGRRSVFTTSGGRRVFTTSAFTITGTQYTRIYAETNRNNAGAYWWWWEPITVNSTVPSPWIDEITMLRNGNPVTTITSGDTVTVRVGIESNPATVNVRVYAGTATNPRAHYIGPLTFSAGQTSRTTSAFTITNPASDRYTRIFVTATNSAGSDEWERSITVNPTVTVPSISNVTMLRNGVATTTINSGDSVTARVNIASNTATVTAQLYVGTASDPRAYHVGTLTFAPGVTERTSDSFTITNPPGTQYTRLYVEATNTAGSASPFTRNITVNNVVAIPSISNVTMLRNGVATTTINSGDSVTARVNIASNSVTVTAQLYVGTASNPRAYHVGPLTFAPGVTERISDPFTITNSTGVQYTRLYVEATNTVGSASPFTRNITVNNVVTVPSISNVTMLRNGTATTTINSGDSVTARVNIASNTATVTAQLYVGTASDPRAYHVGALTFAPGQTERTSDLFTITNLVGSQYTRLYVEATNTAGSASPFNRNITVNLGTASGTINVTQNNYNVNSMVRANVTVNEHARSWVAYWIRNGVVTNEEATRKTVAPFGGTFDVGVVTSTEYTGVAIYVYNTATPPTRSGNPTDTSNFTVNSVGTVPSISSIAMLRNGTITTAINSGDSVTVRVNIAPNSSTVVVQLYVGTASNPRAHHVGPLTFTPGQTERNSAPFTITNSAGIQYTRLYAEASNVAGSASPFSRNITVNTVDDVGAVPLITNVTMLRNSMATTTINSGDSVTARINIASNTATVTAQVFLGTSTNPRAWHVGQLTFVPGQTERVTSPFTVTNSGAIRYDRIFIEATSASGAHNFTRNISVNDIAPQIGSVVVTPNTVGLGDTVRINVDGIANVWRIMFYAIFEDGTEEFIAWRTNPSSSMHYELTLNSESIRTLRVRAAGAEEAIVVDIDVAVVNSASADEEIIMPMFLGRMWEFITRPFRREIVNVHLSPPTINGVSEGGVIQHGSLRIEGRVDTYPTDRVLLFLARIDNNGNRVGSQIIANRDVARGGGIWNFTIPASDLTPGHRYRIAVVSRGPAGRRDVVEAWSEKTFTVAAAPVLQPPQIGEVRLATNAEVLQIMNNVQTNQRGIPLLDLWSGETTNIAMTLEWLRPRYFGSTFLPNGRHSDWTPMASRDVQAVQRMGSWSWNARPGIITLNGYSLAVGFHIQPHLMIINPAQPGSPLDQPNFGHMCLYFKDSVGGGESTTGGQSYRNMAAEAQRLANQSASAHSFSSLPIMQTFEAYNVPVPDNAGFVAVDTNNPMWGEAFVSHNYPEIVWAGTTVDIEARINNDNGNFEFVRWEITEGKAVIANPFSSNTSFVMPYGEELVYIIAIFRPHESNTQIFTEVNNETWGSVWQSHNFLMPGNSVALQARPHCANGAFEFSHWEVLSGNVTIEDPTSSYVFFEMPNSDVSIRAIFQEIENPVFVNIAVNNEEWGWAFASSQATIPGEGVALTAQPASGLIFSHWEVHTGNPQLGDIFSMTTSFVMPDGNVSVRAIFEALENSSLINIESSDDGYAWASHLTASPGVEIMLNAVPFANMEFDRWEVLEGNIVIGNPKSPDTSFFMPNGNISVRAIFSVATENDIPFGLVIPANERPADCNGEPTIADVIRLREWLDPVRRPYVNINLPASIVAFDPQDPDRTEPTIADVVRLLEWLDPVRRPNVVLGPP
jgi:hypothetical protein